VHNCIFYIIFTGSTANTIFATQERIIREHSSQAHQNYQYDMVLECLPLSKYIEAKDDGSGGDNRSYKTRKATTKSLPPTNQHPTFYRPNILPVAQPTASEH